jgi:hypothetical protein
MSRDAMAVQYQCDDCGGLSVEKECSRCARTNAIRTDESKPRPGGVRVRDAAEKNLDIAKPEPPAWLTGAVGGIIVGAVLGVVAGHYLAQEYWLAGAIGAAVGGLAGAIMGR